MSERNPDGTFKQGVSGNPRGRPRSLPKVVKAWREHTDEAIETVLRVMRTGEDKDALAAAKECLNRGWGQAKIPVHLMRDGDEDEVAELSDAELEEIVRGEDDEAEEEPEAEESLADWSRRNAEERDE
ncbi:MAG: hypothetical protein HC927_03320 [Deltaproteobacteria bacterium]|nr:hypothetical protein [Deltaproteobacteria bacterium]